MKTKKRFILSGVFLIILSSFIIATVFSLNDEIKKLKDNNSCYEIQLEEIKTSLNKSEEENRELKEQIEELDKSNNDLKEELENTTEEYNRVNDLYQKELQSVNFNEDNLLEKSNITSNKLRVVLKNTGLQGLEEAYIEAEKEYGVNAIFLVALTAEESGWGRSNRAISQNNLSGFAVYSSGSKGATFSSKTNNILETAKLLKNQYLTAGGSYYSGLSIYSVNSKYCPDDGGKWANNISSIANKIESDLNSR